MNEIFKRVSVRKFKEIKVEEEKIEILLRAAMQAPSAGNQQPWEFVVVENEGSLKELSKLSPYAKCVSDAPLAIVIMANKERFRFAEYWQQDLGAATQNILLEAIAQDLGGVWLGVAPESDRMEYVSKILNLNNNMMVYSVVAIGYPEILNKSQDRYDENRVIRIK